jgi:hypothetical protein
MIYGYQQAVYERLLKRGKAHRSSCRMDLPIRPRFHSLVIGPTGSGKTFLAEEAAEALGFEVYMLNASGWIVMGARETPTLHTIAEWLAGLPSKKTPCFIFDEIDKCSGEESWSRFMRAEMFALLDGRLAGEITGVDMEEAEAALQRCWFLGCGAFESLWTEKGSMGFREETPECPSGKRLAGLLQRELVNRWHPDILVLPSPTKDDYESMMSEVINLFQHDDEAYQVAAAKGWEMLPGAVRDRSGARYAEALVSAVIEEFADVRDPEPAVEASPAESDEDHMIPDPTQDAIEAAWMEAQRVEKSTTWDA